MHEPFIHHCLELAEQGRGAVGNGALVGAVLVRDGKIIAEGHHAAFGMAHAERDLLERFTDTIQSEDVLYVNLEPHCHHGKTPPCTDIILERGVRHLVYGMQDPDQRVAGKGNEILRSGGVHVFGPVSLPLCESLNRGFVSVRTKNRPFITLKQAMTKDGKIANDDGLPMRITSEEQDVWSHTNLRATHDAILVGVGTVISDNPRLDTRLATSPTPNLLRQAQDRPPPDQPSLSLRPTGGRGERQYIPWRIILDRTLRIPPDARVVTDGHRNRTMIIHGPVVDHDMDMAVAQLRERGVRTVECAVNGELFDWSALWHALITPSDAAYQGVTSVLVEGGLRTHRAFRQSYMVDCDVVLVG